MQRLHSDGGTGGDIGLQGLLIDDDDDVAAAAAAAPMTERVIHRTAIEVAPTNPTSTSGSKKSTIGEHTSSDEMFLPSRVSTSSKASSSTTYISADDDEIKRDNDNNDGFDVTPVSAASIRQIHPSNTTTPRQSTQGMFGLTSTVQGSESIIDHSATNAEASPGSTPNNKDHKGLPRRLSRLHNDIAGPIALRPAAGEQNGPIITPRRASAGKRSAKSQYSSKSSSSKDDAFVNSIWDGSALHASPSASSQITVKATSASNDAAPPTPVAALPASPVPGMSSSDITALQRWVLSIGCVNFDLDHGPDLQFLYPSLGISREERDNIAFSSFPDTSIFDDGHAIFSWRIREVPLESSASEAPVIALPSSTSTSGPSMCDDHSNGITSGTATPSSFVEGSSAMKKGTSSTSKRFLAGFDRMSRASVTRRASHDDKPEPISSKDEGGKASAHGDGNLQQAPIARRNDSTASTSSSVSADNSPGAFEGGEKILRTASPLSSEVINATTSLTGSSNAYSTAVVAKRANSNTSTNYIHGYCYFRQKRDATIKRGYFQKSLVILSHLPYVSFFSELVRKIGPLYFEKGMPVLEAFCQDVQKWQTPEPGSTMHLPVLGSVISVELPFHSFSQSSKLQGPQAATSVSASAGGGNSTSSDSGHHKANGGTSEEEPILASIPSTPLLDVFREAIGDLWLLWECLLLAEPVLVIGTDPTACSEAVWHMLDLIKPIPFAGDFRPFFTIHDSDFSTLVNKNKPTAGTIIGATNPFMLQTCKHWPHILKVGKARPRPVAHAKHASDGHSNTGGIVGSGGGVVNGGGIAGGNSAGGGGPEHSPGLVSKRKRRVSKERTLIKQLQDVIEGKGNAGSANDALRKYFADLTERFLAPLNRYVSSLIPADFTLSSPMETPQIKAFNTTAFLASLKLHGTPLPIKSRNLPTGAAIRQSLYVDFLRCPNFSLWLHSRIRQSQEEQYMRKLVALEKGSIADFASVRSETEARDLYLRLNNEVRGINDRLLAGRRERELEPNSRWKSQNNGSGSSGNANDDAHRAQARLSASFAGNVDVGSHSMLDIDKVTSEAEATSPLHRLVNLPATPTSASWIRQTLAAPGWQRSFTHAERTLLTRKAGLIDQMNRLRSTMDHRVQAGNEIPLRKTTHQSTTTTSATSTNVL